MNKLTTTIKKTKNVLGAFMAIAIMLSAFALPAKAQYDYSYDDYDNGSAYSYDDSYDNGSSYGYDDYYDNGSAYSYDDNYDNGSAYSYDDYYDNGSAYSYDNYDGCSYSNCSSYDTSYDNGYSNYDYSYDNSYSGYDYSNYDNGYNYEYYDNGCNSGCQTSYNQQQQPYVYNYPSNNQQHQQQNQQQSTGPITNNNNNSNHVVINVPPTGTNNPPPQTQSLQASCIANPTNARIGDTVTWTVTNASGGTGNYSFSWAGTDGLSGNGQSVNRSYSTQGTKYATVTVTSGSQSVQANCQTNIQNDNNDNNDLQGSCIATPSNPTIGQTVTWSVQNVFGGNGSFTYYWSGTDGLNSNDRTVYRTYNNSGTKYATVRIRSSDGQEISRQCDVTVRQNGNLSSNITLSQNTPPTNGNLSSGLFLSQVPYTGAGFSLKMALFIAGIIIWSAFVAYLFVSKRKTDQKRSRIEAFKRQNMLEKGMI